MDGELFQGLGNLVLFALDVRNNTPATRSDDPLRRVVREYVRRGGLRMEGDRAEGTVEGRGVVLEIAQSPFALVRVTALRSAASRLVFTVERKGWLWSRLALTSANDAPAARAFVTRELLELEPLHLLRSTREHVSMVLAGDSLDARSLAAGVSLAVGIARSDAPAYR